MLALALRREISRSEANACLPCFNVFLMSQISVRSLFLLRFDFIGPQKSKCVSAEVRSNRLHSNTEIDRSCVPAVVTFFFDLRLIFMEFPRTFKSITNNVDSLIYYSLRINCRHIKTPKKKTKQNIVVFVITFVCSRFHEAFFVLDTLNARIFFFD